MSDFDDVRERLNDKIDRLRQSRDALADGLREAVRILAFGIEGEVIPKETALQLCIDPYGTLNHLRATLAEHAKETL